MSMPTLTGVQLQILLQLQIAPYPGTVMYKDIRPGMARSRYEVDQALDGLVNYGYASLLYSITEKGHAKLLERFPGTPENPPFRGSDGQVN